MNLIDELNGKKDNAENYKIKEYLLEFSEKITGGLTAVSFALILYYSTLSALPKIYWVSLCFLVLSLPFLIQEQLFTKLFKGYKEIKLYAKEMHGNIAIIGSLLAFVGFALFIFKFSIYLGIAFVITMIIVTERSSHIWPGFKKENEKE